MSTTRHREAIIALDHAAWCEKQLMDAVGDQYYFLFLSFMLQAIEDAYLYDKNVVESAYQKYFD